MKEDRDGQFDFVWIGPPENGNVLCADEGVVEVYEFCRHWVDKLSVIAAGRRIVLFLSSAEDPCPYVVLESLAAGIEVLYFASALGYSHRENVPLLNVVSGSYGIEGATNGLRRIASSPFPTQRDQRDASDYVRESFRAWTPSYAARLPTPPLARDCSRRVRRIKAPRHSYSELVLTPSSLYLHLKKKNFFFFK